MLLLLLLLISTIIFLALLLLKKKDKFEYPKKKCPHYSYYGSLELNNFNGPNPCDGKNINCKNINKSINLEDIVKIYKDLSYDSEELPNGGLLISMISNQYLCNNSDYSEFGKNKACLDAKDCKLTDLKDIKKLLIDTAKENLTSCYALDTSYMRTDFPSVLFGPVLGADIEVPITMNIGIILDITKLKKYVGCMAIVDSGSIGRYNFKENKINKPGYIPGLVQGTISTTDINSQEITDGYTQLVNSKKGSGLAQAGCGLQNGFQEPNLSGIINDEYLSNGKINKYRGAKNAMIDEYNDFTKKKLLNGSWGSLKQQLLKRTSWKYFIEMLKKKACIINEIGNAKFWKSLVSKSNNGQYVNIYAENEVDIFVPNNPIKNGGQDCDPSDEFIDIWKECILGIFTNNRCPQDIKYNKLCYSCGKLEEYDCDKLKCCCNNNFNEELVKKLVFKYNQESDNIINGYIMNDDFNLSKDYPKPNNETHNYDLKIKQITEYKSYYLIPTRVDIIDSNIIQYWYEIKNKNKNRTVAIAIPKNFNGKYLMQFDFTVNYKKIGSMCNNEYLYDGGGGVIDINIVNKYCKSKNGWAYGFDKYQKYLHSQLQEGVAILSLTECDYDYGAYLPGKDPKDNNDCTMYWNNEDNSDARYLKELFKNLYCNNFVDENCHKLNIDYDNMSVLGYSVGAQMVSRVYNNFPTMKTNADSSGQLFNFPKIKFGIMIGGGTLFCYSEKKNNYNLCPENKTEPIYDNNIVKYDKHPYTLLIQSTKDSFADPLAAKKYYNSFPINLRGNKNKYSKNEKVYKTYSDSTIHGISSDIQVNDMIKFSKYYFNLR